MADEPEATTPATPEGEKPAEGEEVAPGTPGETPTTPEEPKQ